MHNDGDFECCALEKSSLEEPDVHSSSKEYAARFSGEVGEWFLKTQGEIVSNLLLQIEKSAPIRSILDVGGGHAQLTPYLRRFSDSIVVTGSDPVCAERLSEWGLLSNQVQFVKSSLNTLPFPDKSFDVVLCFRQLTHLHPWQPCLSELTRTARLGIIVDYPTPCSVNIVSKALFFLKKRVEGNTRPFELISESNLRQVLKANDWEIAVTEKQFLLPMALYRRLGAASFGRKVELLASTSGLTSVFGSPVITLARPRRGL